MNTKRIILRIAGFLLIFTATAYSSILNVVETFPVPNELGWPVTENIMVTFDQDYRYDHSG